MMLPTIHLNGTSREELIRQNMNSALLISKAIDSMYNGRPHGRDYYPQDSILGTFRGNAYRRASAEYEARIDKLNSVYKELLALNEYLNEESH